MPPPTPSTAPARLAAGSRAGGAGPPDPYKTNEKSTFSFLAAPGSLMAALGALLADLGVLLGRSWAALGTLLAALGPLFGRQKCSQRFIFSKNNMFTKPL